MSALDFWLKPLAEGEPRSSLVEAGELSIRVERHDGESFLALYGELDVASAPLLDRELNRAIASTPTIVVDLSALEFIDSNGIRSLLSASRIKGRDVCYLRPPPDVARILQMVGADECLRYLD